MINYKGVINIVGIITIIVGIFMVLPTLVSYFGEGDDAGCFAISSGIAIVIGSLMYLIKPKTKSIRKREGYLIVALGWITMCLIGALPYVIHHDISYAQAFFESCSGFTTTGATIFTDIESLSSGTLFWRSLTQWIGGMGIIVFTIAIFPLLGIGGVELFVAESPGPNSDKFQPRIKEVAKRLWIIYLSLTAILFVILLTMGGMSVFDAINHAMTTMSTGGFSTKNASIAAYDSGWVQYPIILFMFIGGMNYTIIYLIVKGRLKRVWQSDELKFYVTLVFLLIAVVALGISAYTDHDSEYAIRTGAFQVISVITTTGFITADYTAWHIGYTLLFFILLFVGACAGSTSGGIKIIRHYVFLKNSRFEFKRLLNPDAYVRIKVDDQVVNGRIITHILVFLLCYLFLFISGSFAMIILLQNDPTPLLTSLGATATCLGNVGPAIGSVGPVDNFAHIPDVAKVVLSFLMIIGRLEIFTILILFTKVFWRV